MNNDSFAHDNNTQFALSYELLHLLKWLEQHDIEKLKKIIAKAVAHGLHDEIQRSNSHVNQNILEEMHHSIVDFFELMDNLLNDAINQHVEKRAREKNLLPTLDHFDGSLLSHDTVRTSIENTTKQLDAHPHINPKEQLCKELLKQWKPLNSDFMN
jgi:hypothetical protein